MDGWKEKFALTTKVLVAGGKIESRCTEHPNFVEYYVFTKEQLEKFYDSAKQTS